MDIRNIDPRRSSSEDLNPQERAAIDELTKVGKRGSYVISGEQPAEQTLEIYSRGDVRKEAGRVTKAVTVEGRNRIIEEKGGLKEASAAHPKMTRQMSGTDFDEWPVYSSEEFSSPSTVPEHPHSNLVSAAVEKAPAAVEKASVKKTETPEIGDAGKLVATKSGGGLLRRIRQVFVGGKSAPVTIETDWKAKAEAEKKSMGAALKAADIYLADEKTKKVLLGGNDKSFNLFLADRGVKIDPKNKEEAAEIFDRFRGEYLDQIAILVSKKLTVEDMTEKRIDQLLKSYVSLEIARRQAMENLSLDEKDLHTLSRGGDIAGLISDSLKQANDVAFTTSKTHIEADFSNAPSKEIREHKKGEATPNESGTKVIGKLKVGYSSTTNFKSPPFINEDRHLETAILVGKDKAPLLAVFDGHGGTTTSEFLKGHLDRFIENELNRLEAPLTDDKIYLALNQAFLNCNRELFESKKDTDYNTLTDGATATVGIVLNGDLWVASVGDSRALVIGSKGEVIGLSRDAEPTSTKFQEKIVTRGGEIIRGRVNGELGVATAFGDFHLKGMSVLPEVTKFSLASLGQNSLFLVGCDGLFDGGTSQEVGMEAYKLLSQGKSPKDIAQTLALKARNVDTKTKSTNDDDITVVCTRL